MSYLEKVILETFGNKLRVRVSGICLEDEKILLVKHISLGKKGIFWSPPGGGINFNEAVEECLKREFKEETGFIIEIEEFLLVNEFLHPPLHSIELFFKVKIIGGSLLRGIDPEMSFENQIIKEVKFLSFEEIGYSDPDLFHSIFKMLKSPNDTLKFKGFFKS